MSPSILKMRIETIESAAEHHLRLQSRSSAYAPGIEVLTDVDAALALIASQFSGSWRVKWGIGSMTPTFGVVIVPLGQCAAGRRIVAGLPRLLL